MLIGSNNPFNDPLIDPRFFTTEFDITATREGIKKAINFTKAPIWKDIITGPSDPLLNATTDPELEEIIRSTGLSGLHPVGTASMSPRNASWGVVDPDLLVKEVSGLRIVDASVMVSASLFEDTLGIDSLDCQPYIPCAHTQTAVYIIAERAADLIKNAWRQS